LAKYIQRTHQPVRNVSRAWRRGRDALVGVETGNTEGVTGGELLQQSPLHRLEATRSPEGAPSWPTTLPRPEVRDCVVVLRGRIDAVA